MNIYIIIGLIIFSSILLFIIIYLSLKKINSPSHNPSHNPSHGPSPSTSNIYNFIERLEDIMNLKDRLVYTHCLSPQQYYINGKDGKIDYDPRYCYKEDCKSLPKNYWYRGDCSGLLAFLWNLGPKTGRSCSASKLCKDCNYQSSKSNNIQVPPSICHNCDNNKDIQYGGPRTSSNASGNNLDSWNSSKEVCINDSDTKSYRQCKDINNGLLTTNILKNTPLSSIINISPINSLASEQHVFIYLGLDSDNNTLLTLESCNHHNCHGIVYGNYYKLNELNKNYKTIRIIYPPSKFMINGKFDIFNKKIKESLKKFELNNIK